MFLKRIIEFLPVNEFQVNRRMFQWISSFSFIAKTILPFSFIVQFIIE